jgi:hypothetical protein
MRCLSLLVLVLLGSHADADSLALDGTAPARDPISPARPIPTPAPSLGLRDLPDFAIGVNTPIGWFQDDRRSLGASLYVGIGDHHAIRGNIARYEHQPLGAYHPESEGTYIGELNDVGIGWVFYPRQLWQGLTLEAGLLRRDRDIEEGDSFGGYAATKTRTYAGRAMIGWSAHHKYMFIAAAVGLSAGRERGTEIVFEEVQMDDSLRRGVNRMQVDGEVYLRIGFALNN